MDKVLAFNIVADELKELHERKNKDYGNSFSKTFEDLGIISSVTRMSDKMNRLTNLVTKGNQQVKDESIEDTLKDLASYAIMTIVELRDKKD